MQVKLYNFGTPGFNMATGGFTQLVWRGTTKLGCGAAVCGKFNGQVLVVCNYSPGGNIVNEGYFKANVLPAGAGSGARRRGGRSRGGSRTEREGGSSGFDD
jgi:hypothetical protein